MASSFRITVHVYLRRGVLSNDTIPVIDSYTFISVAEPAADPTIILDYKTHSIEVNLPEVMKQNLSAMISPSSPHTIAPELMGMDAHEFVHNVLGITMYADIKHVEIEEKDEITNLKPGDIVMLYSDRDKLIFRIASIYLGNGVHMVKYGSGGSIVFTTLKEMGKSAKCRTDVFRVCHITDIQ